MMFDIKNNKLYATEEVLLHAEPLHPSIVKWAVIAFYLYTHPEVDGVEDDGSNTCALCLAHDHCNNCPVMLAVNDSGCFQTPYYMYLHSCDNYSKHVYAIDEFEFLLSLLQNRPDWERFVQDLKPEERRAVNFAEAVVRYRTSKLSMLDVSILYEDVAVPDAAF